MYTGSCLCGAVQFRIDAELAAIELCHCMQCRKAQGGPFAANIPVSKTAFTVVQGQDMLKSYASSPGKERFFCAHCGSPVFSARQSLPQTVRVRAGLINEPLAARPQSHAYVESQCNWWTIDDDLPQYDAAYGGARAR